MFYLITGQTVQTWILLNIPSCDIKASTVKGTSHSVTNQCSWIIKEHAVIKYRAENVIQMLVCGDAEADSGRRFTFDKRCVVMRALASNSAVLTVGTDKQHFLVPHSHLLHPKHKDR